MNCRNAIGASYALVYRFKAQGSCDIAFVRLSQSQLHDWLGFELLSAFAIETTSFRGVCWRSCRLPLMPLRPSPSSKLFIAVVYSVPRCRTLDAQGSSLIVQQLSVIDLHYWELLHFKLYGSEKSLPVVEALRPLSGLHSIALSALERLIHPRCHLL
ncbi:hypothetical protein Scep_004882 [Stephania cephalantha]|uniref:Uncharacterized protein n=1 Tax=Stephania cephalantha TaxID=152367 RepID=A0AAP0KT94_9MAGN